MNSQFYCLGPHLSLHIYEVETYLNLQSLMMICTTHAKSHLMLEIIMKQKNANYFLKVPIIKYLNKESIQKMQ